MFTLLARHPADGIDRYILSTLTSVTIPDHSGIEYVYNGLEINTIDRRDAQGNSQYQHRCLNYDLAGRELAAQLIGSAGQ